MARRGIIALMSCIFALSLAMAGCGGNPADAGKTAFVGTWDLVEMSQEGSTTSSDDIKTLKDLGLEVFVNINDDGTMALVLFGSVLEGTWTATNAQEGTANLGGQDTTMKLDGNRLTIENNDTSLVFEKGEPKEVPAASEAASSASGSAESSASGEAASGDGAAASTSGEASGQASASAAA